MSDPFVLLRDAPIGRPARWLRFEAPRRLLVARRLDEVVPVLRAVEEAVGGRGETSGGGLWAAGFLAYEAAPALDPTLGPFAAAPPATPLAWWGVFEAPRVVEPPPPPAEPLRLDWRARLEPDAYRAALAAIRRHIAAGDTYQANFTFPLEASLGPRDERDEIARKLFAALWHAQRGGLSAFVELGDVAVVSASPELFFRLDGRRVVTRPMKGTARRGRWPAEDAARRAELQSEKNRAENLMIVDMMRNDLGRVAAPGSVHVSRLFTVETYPTVHQLTSEVVARTDAGFVDLLRALFPCASITGAPKRSTAAILGRLEAEPRGVYTGAIGYVGPGRTAQLSVAIRTAVVDRARGVARYDVGGGIVWDSDVDAELAEARAKALVLTAEPPLTARRPALFETILWRPKSAWHLLDRHLDRLEASARFFDLPGAASLRVDARRALEDAARAWNPETPSLETPSPETPSPETSRRRVRLIFDPSSETPLIVESRAFPCSGRAVWTLAVDRDHPVDPDDLRLFHKTTDRSLYDAARARHPTADDVVLVNTRGELTESTVANLVLRLGDRHLTPPLASGLLPGVYRAELLERGRLEEAVLSPADLSRADAVFLVNGLRGWIRCRIVDG